MFEQTKKSNPAPIFSISCSDVPNSLLHKDAAKNHFQKFGKIIRIILRPKRNQCVILFDKYDSARKAILDSGFYEGKSFKVAWTHKEKIKQVVKKKEVDPDWTNDPEVKAELDAMRGAFSNNRTYTLRSEAMAIDPTPSISKSPLNKLRWKKKEKLVTKKPETSTYSNEQAMQLLYSIMKRTQTSEEKFRVLDARDKLIRLKFSRQTNLANTSHTIGTCPDMCPEKERLMREAQHQVAVYEQLSTGKNNQMNHAIGVKQYSRSSADQEVPLAHELRPVQVLELTMGYLLHCIMDLCDTRDVNLAEWYHFLWDRTRGIRKDITQQELCSQGSVKLVEQCARFHIHCSARLVAEDVSVFDQKINTENLTKCLQTLKYMYHDLSLKNEKCPNEAEFRGYIVLLNLNDGNFMWEVQQLKLEIQCSSEIKFALNVYSALDKNNYVRFFKLVKSTTYLNACILLRYFNQVRIRALSRIIKSYSPRQLFTQFPVTEFCNILAFEDIENTIAFIEYYGLCVNTEKTHVILDRKMFHQPDIPFFLERAIKVIETKRNCSVGEVVCGEHLPGKFYKNHTPHKSFDENGYLKTSEIPREWQAQYQKSLIENVNKAAKDFSEDPKDEVEVNLEKLFKFSDPVPLNYEMEGNIPSSTNFIFQTPTFVSEGITEVDNSKTFFSFASTRSQSPLGSIFGNKPPNTEFVKPFWNVPATQSSIPSFKFDIPISTNAGIKSFEPEPDPPKIDIFGNIGSVVFQKPEITEEKLSDQPIFSFNTTTVTNEVVEEPPEIDEKLESERILEALRKQRKDEKEAKKLIEEQRRKQKELEEENIRKKEMMRKMELLKKQQAYEQKFQKDVTNVLNDILIAVDTEIKKEIRVQQFAEKLKRNKLLLFVKKWRECINISQRKRKNFFDNPTWVSHRSVKAEAKELYFPSQDLTLHDIKRYKTGISQTVRLKPKSSIQKIPIFELVWKTLFEKLNDASNKKLQLDIFWKVGVSLPTKNESSVILHNLESDLRNAFDWNEYNINLAKYLSLNGGTFNKCIQEITDSNQIGTYDAIIFFEIGNLTSNTRDRLTTLFKCHKKTCLKRIPLIVIQQNCCVTETFKMNELVQNIVSCDYKILYADQDIESTLSNSLKWLAMNSDQPPPLELDRLSTIICNCIADELWCRLVSSSNINKRLWVLLKDPNVVINLHNEAVYKLIDILCDEVLCDYPKFAEEFKELLNKNDGSTPCSYEYFPNYWNDKRHLFKIKTALQSLILPEFTENWHPKDQEEFELQICGYSAKVLKNYRNVPMKVLSMIFRKNDPENAFDEIMNRTLWLDIIEVIVHEKLKEIFYDFNQEILCTYNIEAMSNFRKFPWWYHSEEISSKIKNVVIEDMIISKDDSFSFYVDESDFDFEETISKLDELEDSKQSNLEFKKELLQLSAVIDDLEKSMNIQKKIVSRFKETTDILMED